MQVGNSPFSQCKANDFPKKIITSLQIFLDIFIFLLYEDNATSLGLQGKYIQHI